MTNAGLPEVNAEESFRDELAIRALADRYSDAVNHSDLQVLRDCWTADGIWDLGEPINVHEEGADNIVAEVKRALDSFEFFAQMPHAGVVSVQGEKATARWTLQEMGRAAGGEAGMFILASYTDELVRQDGHWRFAKRSYRVIYLDDAAPPGRAFSAKP